MKCPHCHTGVNVEFEEHGVNKNPDRPGYGYELTTGECPECNRLIVLLNHGETEERKSKDSETTWPALKAVEREEVLYPKHVLRTVEPEVPDKYKSEFLEACSVLHLSPKASAALSRRLLQKTLQDQFKIQRPSLAQEIEEFIQRGNTPSYLAEAIDAVRNIGNFAAHPLKDTNSGQIVEVEPGEAEWLLEVLESLFDFAFVQPIRLQERKKKLNAKFSKLTGYEESCRDSPVFSGIFTTRAAPTVVLSADLLAGRQMGD
ncbi:MAG: DUF4145 domain-containing protein, partial [Candidatus Binatia bacterium]